MPDLGLFQHIDSNRRKSVVLIMGAAGAREIRKSDDRELVYVVEELSIASGLPRPRVFVMDTDAMNATGTSPDKAAVVAPLAAVMIQMAVSRKREYLADATGAAQ